MKNIFGILISGFLLFGVIILLLPMQVNASDTVYSEGFFEYYVDDSSILISGYLGKDAEITVPSVIAGYPVSGIVSGAFADNKYVERINLPATIMSIEQGAFSVGQSVTYYENSDRSVTVDEEKNMEKYTGTDMEESGIDEYEDSLNESNLNRKEQSYEGIYYGDGETRLTVDSKNRLVKVEQDGKVTVIDDDDEYNFTEKADGTVVIQNANGDEIYLDDNNKIKNSRDKYNLYVIAIGSVVIVILAAVRIITCLIHRKN